MFTQQLKIYSYTSLNPIHKHNKTVRIIEREREREKTLTGSVSTLTEGPMAPSLDRSWRSLEGQLDLRVVISPQLHTEPPPKNYKKNHNYNNNNNNNNNN